MSLTITRRNLFPFGLLDKQTVSDTAVGLDFITGAKSALIIVEDQGIRWRDDGIDPTASVGTLIDSGADPFPYEGDLSAFKMIRASGIDATVQSSFYNGGPAGTKWDVSAATVGHYRLNESAPNKEILDASGNGFNGVLEGGKTTRAVSIAGLVSTGTAFNLNGATDLGNIDNVLNGTLGSATKGTLACVVEPDNVGGAESFITFGDTSAATFISFRQDNVQAGIKCQFRLANVEQWRFTSVATHLTNGVKTWVALVHDGISPKLFVDGIEVSILFDITFNLPAWLNAAPLIDNARIGSLNQGGAGEQQELNGTIDDVRILDRDATRLELAAIHNNNLGLETTSGVFPV